MKNLNRVPLFGVCLAILLAGLFSHARAAGTWYTFSEENPPLQLGYLVSDFTGTVSMTFLGDCTLGGEESSRNSALGFVRRIRENGYDFPMRYLSRLTASDDVTVANLEGVLTDRKLTKVEKEYNFSGPTAYTRILTGAGIECVTLANNHSHDYGDAGYADTRAALEAAGVSYFGTDCMAVWQSDEGVLIGFAGAFYSVSGSRGKQYDRQMEILRDLGCAVIVTVMHAGTEYVYEPNGYQKAIAARARKDGSSLVIGHHPHVVQGYEILSGMPVVYSLGNCSFGGTTHAKDSDALVVRAELRFEDGIHEETVLHFFPVSITSDSHYNNYSPMFLAGKDAQRVLTKLEKSTGNGFEPFTEEDGAVVRIPSFSPGT